MIESTVHGEAWSTGKVVRSLLLSDSAIREIVSDRVHPLVAPEGTDLPLCVYRLESTDRTGGHMKGSSGITSRVYTVQYHGHDYDELEVFALAFRARLESWRGIEGDLKIRRIDIVDESDEDYDRPESGEDYPVFTRVFTIRLDHIEIPTSLPSGSYGA